MKWTNKVLKQYILKEYTVNQRRLEYLEKTVKLINFANRIDYSKSSEKMFRI